MAEQQPTKSAAKSLLTQYCDACKRDVTLGTGGEHNWKNHMGSKEHARGVQVNLKTTHKITSFFRAVDASSTMRAAVSCPARLPGAGLSKSERKDEL
ncbi:hypothetical protein C8Q72DRAFT_805485, partial [Fomitopsis betulina]